MTISGQQVSVESSQTIKGGISYFGASMTLPAAAVRSIPADKRFDVMHEALGKNIGGKVIEQKDIKVDPISGKEYIIQKPSGMARLQIYTISNQVVYTLVEGKTRKDLTSQTANDFVGSLQFTDKAKEIFRDAKR
jgi:hypothetical protein